MALPSYVWLVCVLLPLGVLSQSSLSELEALAAAHPGCYFEDFKYEPLLDGSRDQLSLANCQKQCRWNTSCTGFTYWPAAKLCKFADTSSAKQVATTSGAVSGFGVCKGKLQRPECSSDLPGNGFPSYTVQASNAAWPSGEQPVSLECWPRDFFGSSALCGQAMVLEDFDKGWPGKCSNLRRIPLVFGKKACSALCSPDPKCASWQVVSEVGDEGACYQGLGEDCFVNPYFSPVAAQRLLHGKVRKLMDFAGWQIAGLSRVFLDDTSYFEDDQDTAKACSLICYSSIECQYWQYAPKYGCWVDDPSTGYGPPTPLTLDWAYRSTPFALDCIAGEMIQHYCPPTDVLAQDASTVVECADRGGRYTSTTFSDQTSETNPKFCQEACSRRPQCSFFTFWPKGLCQLTGSDSSLVVADDTVLYGPMDCSETGTTNLAPSIDPGAFASVPVAQAAAPPTPAPTVGPTVRTIDSGPHEAGTKMLYVVGMNFTVLKLDYSLLGLGHTLSLQIGYAQTLAGILGVPQTDIMEKSDGTGAGAVTIAKGVLAMTTLLTAWVQNRPSDSNDISYVKDLILSPSTVAALQATTVRTVHSGNQAVMGMLEVVAGDLTVLERVAPVPQGSPFEGTMPFLLFLVLLCGAGLSILSACSGGCSLKDAGSDSDSEEVSFALKRAQFGETTGQGRNVTGKARMAKAGKSYWPSRKGEFTV